MESYYNILGVAKGAGDKDIRKAFRRLARKYHPDVNPGDHDAEDRFKRISEAYEVLSDAEDRKKYDRYGDKWKYADQIESRYGDGAGSPFRRSTRTGRAPDGFDWGPFSSGDDPLGGLGDFLGRQGRGATASRIETDVDVSLDEAFSGTRRKVTITARGTDRRIEVTIPPGVDSGSVVRIKPGEDQELLLKVTVSPHRRFTRSGGDLHAEIDVPLEDAILGGEVELDTLTGKVRVKIPPESRNGQRIRLAGQGMPRLGKPEERGDLFVVVRPTMPRDMSDEERELIVRLKELRAEKGDDR